MRLIIGQNQGRTVTPVGGHLQGQVDPSKWDGCKRCGYRQGRGGVEEWGREYREREWWVDVGRGSRISEQGQD